MDESVKKAKELIEQEYHSIKTLEKDLSKRIDCNYHTLRHHFVRSMDCSLIEYVNRIRCQKAKLYLINTDWKLNRVAKVYWYNDSKYFSKIFKRIYGKFPTDCRN
jgi:two-component system response regulator YesN